MTNLLKILLFEELNEKLELGVDNIKLKDLTEYINTMNISTNIKDELLEITNNEKTSKSIDKKTKAKIINELLDGSKILSRIKNAKSMEEYDLNFSNLIKKNVNIDDNLYLELHLKDMIMYCESCDTRGFEQHYGNWHRNHF